jgi:hypothetical protein
LIASSIGGEQYPVHICHMLFDLFLTQFFIGSFLMAGSEKKNRESSEKK